MTSRLRDLEIASVLDELSAEIEALGATLCADSMICDRHTITLQAIDFIAQNQRSLAQLLRASCPDAAIEGIGMESLKARFRNGRLFGDGAITNGQAARRA